MADDVAALLGHLGVADAHMVGWSLGGSVLQSLMIRHDRLLRSATLLNAFPNYTPLQHAWLDALIALRQSDISMAAKLSFVMPWGLTPITLSDHDRTMQAVAAAEADPWPTSNVGLEGQGAGLRLYDSRADLGRVTTPTMILAGAEDVLTPVAQSVEMAALIPGAKLKVIGKGGHRMIVEYPDEIVRQISEFVLKNEA
jgi:3-oxoadipate enol-lactonase